MVARQRQTRGDCDGNVEGGALRRKFVLRDGFRWLLAFAAGPLLLLILCEAALRMAGYGSSTRFFVEKQADGKSFHVSNRAFYQQFFSLPVESLVNWDDLEFQVPAAKAENTYRIFIFGGSAANGTPPDSAYSFWRVLGAMLRARFPDTRFEVYNTASPGANSNVMWAAARACTRLEPDLFIVFMGNNEFIGPFGAGSSITSAYISNLGLIRANILLTNLRIAQLVSGRRWKRRSAVVVDPEDIWEYLSKLNPDDPKTGIVYEHFNRNMRDICAAGAGAGAAVILCTMQTNLRNWGPILSEHRPDLTETAKREWKALYEAGLALEQAAAFGDAVEKYTQVAVIDDTYAELQFRLGRCHWELADYEKARECFIRARERDFVPSRSNARINAIVEEVAAANAGRGVYLADCTRRLAQLSPHGVPGREFFYDNVHLTFDGHYAIACTVFEQVARALPDWIRRRAPADADAPARSECERRLALTAWVRHKHVAAILEILPSFQEAVSVDWEENLAWLRRLEAELSEHAGPVGFEKTLAAYREALDLHDEDHYLHTRYVRALLRLGRADDALEEARSLVARFPCRREARRLLASVLRTAGKREKAADEFQKTVTLFPDDAQTCFEWGLMLDEMGQTAAALERYRKAVAINPGHKNARCAEGDALAKLGRTRKARHAYREALTIDPRFLAAYEKLDRLLLEQNDIEGRIAQWQEVVALYPSLALPYYYLGNALEASGEEDAAIEAYGKAVQLNPDDPRAKVYQGMFLEARGDLEGAAQAYREAIGHDPQAFLPYDNLDALHEKWQDPDKRVSEWRRIAEKHPDAARAYFHLGMALEAKQNLEGAIAAYRSACELAPSDPAMQASFGRALVQNGDFQQAIAPIRAALRDNPDIPCIRQDLVRALYEIGDYRAAAEQAEECRRRGLKLDKALLEQVRSQDGEGPADNSKNGR